MATYYQARKVWEGRSTSEARFLKSFYPGRTRHVELRRDQPDSWRWARQCDRIHGALYVLTRCAGRVTEFELGPTKQRRIRGYFVFKLPVRWCILKSLSLRPLLPRRTIFLRVVVRLCECAVFGSSRRTGFLIRRSFKIGTTCASPGLGA